MRDEYLIPSWRLLPTLNKKATVLLSSLADFSVLLGNIPICTPSLIRTSGVQILDEGFLMMAYRDRFAVKELCLPLIVASRNF